MFEIGRLRLLRELAHRGTMIAVGQALGQTSSAVSQQLAVLEREAGVPLFERIGRRVRLTAAGDRLAGHATAILQAVEAAHLEMRAATDRPAGTIVIASFASFARAHLIDLVEQARIAEPDLAVILQELEPPDAITALRTGECDLAISYQYDLVPRPIPNGISIRPLLSEPMLMVLPRRFEGVPDPLDVTLLAGDDWVVGPGASDDALLAQAIGARFGFIPHVTHGAMNYALVQDLAAGGLGVGLVPRMALEGTERLVVRSLAGGTPQRQITALVRPHLASSPNLSFVLRSLEHGLSSAAADR